MAGGLPFESLLELDAMTLLETDRSVLAFGTQPETFRWREASGRSRRYTPDILVTTGFGQVYREVKPWRRFRQDPTLNGRHEAIVAECKARNAGFEIWTCDEIRREPRLSNARSVLAEGRQVGDTVAEGAVRTVLPRCATLSNLAASSGLPPLRALRAILRLVALGEAEIDLDVPFGSSTRILHGRTGR